MLARWTPDPAVTQISSGCIYNVAIQRPYLCFSFRLTSLTFVVVVVVVVLPLLFFFRNNN